jgi:signal transduction histidine kinase
LFKYILQRKNLFALFVIIGIASSFSILSSRLSIQTSSEIVDIAAEDITRIAQDEAHDLSRVVVNKIDSVTTNLQVLSNSPSIQSEDTVSTAQFFDAAQYSTEEVTDYYMWLDSDGTVRAASNIARASYQYNIMWQSEKPPFLTEPQRTGAVYYSGVIHSPSEDTARVYIAYPIIYSLQQDQRLLGDFRGVIVASIRLDTLGALLTSELSPTIESDVSLADLSGTVIYSVDKSAIGMNIFDNPAYITTPILQELTDDSKASVAALLTDSTRAEPDAKIINANDRTFTIAHSPIVHNGNHFWTLYIIAPHVFTDNVAAMLARQDTFTTASLAVTGIVAVGMAYVILSSNKRLEHIVRIRTRELEEANDSLSDSNKQLASANEQLKTHDRLQKEFINVAAHELRTPIMPILAISDVLESKFRQSGHEQITLNVSDYAIISRNARRLERLATDILDVSRIEARSIRLNKEVFNLHELVEHSVNDVRNQFPRDKVKYSVEMDKQTTIYADRSKIGQVLSNLLINAAKFTDEGVITVGTMESSSESERNAINVFVSDTGIGIDNATLPRLFTKFANNAGFDRTQTGSGLGLYISKGIIEAHGGEIRGGNNSHGKGATFYFTLPLTSARLENV